MKNEITQQKGNALQELAERLGSNQKRTAEILKATAFKNCKNDEQFASLSLIHI